MIIAWWPNLARAVDDRDVEQRVPADRPTRRDRD